MYIDFGEENYCHFEFSKDIEFSKDKKKWIKVVANTETIVSGVVYFRKKCTPDEVYGIGVGSFLKLPPESRVGGNVMSLLFGDSFEGKYNISDYKYAFYELFKDCNISVVDSNFLPATVLAENCYTDMFKNCKYLKNAPKLPATTLAKLCYSGMFNGCSKLNDIKMLATDISADRSLLIWVKGVSPTGTFVKSKDATWDTTPGALGYDGVPAGWTVIDDTFPTNEDGMPESTEFSFPLIFEYTERTDVY